MNEYLSEQLEGKKKKMVPKTVATIKDSNFTSFGMKYPQYVMA